jgi:enamine deaminase RidA (YjgF/YER057c/UK114 family)
VRRKQSAEVWTHGRIGAQSRRPRRSIGSVLPCGDGNGSRSVVVAGQVGVDKDGTIGGDVATQTRQAYENVGLALASAGATWADVAKVTNFLVSDDLIDDFFSARGATYAELFPSGAYPPSTLLVVRGLVRPELLVEIEAIAVTN